MTENFAPIKGDFANYLDSIPHLCGIARIFSQRNDAERSLFHRNRHGILQIETIPFPAARRKSSEAVCAKTEVQANPGKPHGMAVECAFRVNPYARAMFQPT